MRWFVVFACLLSSVTASAQVVRPVQAQAPAQRYEVMWLLEVANPDNSQLKYTVVSEGRYIPFGVPNVICNQKEVVAAQRNGKPTIQSSLDCMVGETVHVFTRNVMCSPTIPGDTDEGTIGLGLGKKYGILMLSCRTKSPPPVDTIVQ